jgi:hypothetical protein
VHTFTEGTDARSAWFILLIVAAAAPVLALLVARVARRRPAPRAGAPRGSGISIEPGARGRPVASGWR